MTEKPQRDKDGRTAQSQIFAASCITCGGASLGILLALILGGRYGFLWDTRVAALLGYTLLAALGVLSALVGVGLGAWQLVRHTSLKTVATTGLLLSFASAATYLYFAYSIFFFTGTHVEVLAGMGYPSEVIDNPLQIELFTAVDQPTAKWIYSGTPPSFGWYTNESEGTVPLDIPIPANSRQAAAVPFEPMEAAFGLFVRIDGFYNWYTESARNTDGESHVKVYPMILDGREVSNSYLISWEDADLGEGPSRFMDFTDLIVRLDGVMPVLAPRE